jgi:hypothetical protein
MLFCVEILVLVEDENEDFVSNTSLSKGSHKLASSYSRDLSDCSFGFDLREQDSSDCSSRFLEAVERENSKMAQAACTYYYSSVLLVRDIYVVIMEYYSTTGTTTSIMMSQTKPYLGCLGHASCVMPAVTKKADDCE